MPQAAPQLLPGTLFMLILRALSRGRLHGYAIARWLDERSDGVLAVDGAALYQALHRLGHWRRPPSIFMLDLLVATGSVSLGHNIPVGTTGG